MLRAFYFLCLTGVYSQDLAQLLHKVADHDGLGQKAGNAAFQGVGSHGKDRELCPGWVIQCADLPGGGISGHL